MNWKEFLKPDWKKILLVALFGICILVIMIWIQRTFVPKTTGGELFEPSLFDNFIIYVLIFLILPSYFVNLFFTNEILSPFSTFANILAILAWIILILYWYLLSCIIIWIYNKFKRKVKKK